MERNCSRCIEIEGFEKGLNEKVDGLVKKVVNLNKEIRIKNKEKWENFGAFTKLPLVGNLFYDLFKVPRNLLPEISPYKFNWYKTEMDQIEGLAINLEKMKSHDLNHWGEERVNADFYWDYAGYYQYFHPHNPMLRKDAYKKYEVEGKKELLHVWPLSNLKIESRMDEGNFVLDKISKKVVPLKDCDFSWRAINNPIKRFFARSATEYFLREHHSLDYIEKNFEKERMGKKLTVEAPYFG